MAGEVFVEELSIGSREVLIEWNVLERQIPSSVSSHHAEFAVEGIAKVQGRPSETWKETIRLRGGQHQYAKTSHVEVGASLLCILAPNTSSVLGLHSDFRCAVSC